MSDINFKLTDAWGIEHDYQCREFSVDEQADLHADVAPILAGPLAHVLGAAFGTQAAALAAVQAPTGASILERFQRAMSRVD